MFKIIWSVFLLATLLGAPLACNSTQSGTNDSSGEPPLEPVVPDYCTENNLTGVPFQTEAGGFLFGDLAEDFTVTEADGREWTLSENFTGCDSYLFFSFFEFGSESGRSFMEGLWSVSFVDLIEASAKNVHYFFISAELSETDRLARMGQLKVRFLRELNDLFPEDAAQRAHWINRFHFVSDRLAMVSGSVGGFVSDYINYKNTAAPVDLGDRGQAPAPLPTSFGIGRDQRWDSTGSTSEYVGGPDNLKMIAYNSGFYNHRAELRARLAAETATTVISLVDETVTDRVFLKDVVLPDADAMGQMDTMEFDVAITCPHRNPFGCSEWDRIARISLCTEFDSEDEESCVANTELVRWITPYWRRGRRRWVMDASPFMALMEGGGTQRFKIEMGPSWERATERHTAMSVRLSNRSVGYQSESVVRAFGGGNFNGEYNVGREPFVFTPPVDAKRVEIVSIVSGHGQTDGNGCAEWCNHVHRFTVNDASEDVREISYADIGDGVGCAARANEGVLPGQWGNWSQSRAGWCPGLPVETVRFDITEAVTLGAENSVVYVGSYRGGEPQGGNISMNTYVVWYRD